MDSPVEIPFHDAHTHLLYPIESHTISVLNVDVCPESSVPPLTPFSAGIHPWSLTAPRVDLSFERLQALARSPDFAAVGECGLDKIKGPEWTLQIAAFERQIRLAMQIGAPVVVHCVKAHQEVIEIYQKIKPKVPFLIHGFNNKETILQKFVAAGFYISLGAALLNEGGNAARAVPLIPKNRLLLETDDAPIPLALIYRKAALLLGKNINLLAPVIQRNFTEFFTRR